MNRILNTLSFLLISFSVFAQTDLEQFLTEIETNNYSLKSTESSVEAQKLENRTGLNPSDPSIEGGYLWGTPSAIGNRKDLSVTQEIEFPTVYSNQNKLADIRDEQSDLEYSQQRLLVLQNAAQLWVEMVSLNQKQQELMKRLENAQGLADSYNEMLESGQGNIIDRNKAALYLLQVEKELEQLEQDKQQLSLKVTALNGNRPLLVNELDFMPVQLPENLDQWLAQMETIDPSLQYLGLEIKAGEHSVKVAKGKSMPSISGGYMMENTDAEKFQGVTLGLSIPLWENKNAVKAEQAKTEAVVLQERDYRLQWESELTQIYSEVESAKKLVVSYREQLDIIQQKELLDEALQEGQISLIEYLLELQYNYDAIDQLMEAERQLQKAYARMKVLEL